MHTIKHQNFAKKTEIKEIGFDIVSIPKIVRLIDYYDRETVTIVFTPQAKKYCRLNQ